MFNTLLLYSSLWETTHHSSTCTYMHFLYVYVSNNQKLHYAFIFFCEWKILINDNKFNNHICFLQDVPNSIKCLRVFFCRSHLITLKNNTYLDQIEDKDFLNQSSILSSTYPKTFMNKTYLFSKYVQHDEHNHWGLLAHSDLLQLQHLAHLSHYITHKISPK